MRLFGQAGNGHYSVTTSFDSLSSASDTWTHDGGVQVDAPTSQVINPSVVSGPTGSSGTDGATGPTGAAGLVGGIGTTGPTGATGRTGPAGSNGSAGATGVTGPTGLAGSNGAVGATGPTGANLVMGPQYTIQFGSGVVTPTWYKLGTLSLTSGVRMFSLP